MSYPTRLLEHIVPARTPYNTRVPATLVDRLLSLSAEEIRHLWDPMTCGEDVLPFLAWALSVDIWQSDWPISKKREVTAAAFSDHKHKGTRYLIERYLAYVGATLVRTVASPANSFSTGGFSDDYDRMTWLGTLPQIRLYPFLTSRVPPKTTAFMSATRSKRSFYTDPALGNHSFMQPSQGMTLMGTKATVVKNGVESPASYSVLKDPSSGLAPVRVRVQGLSKATFYGRSFYGAGHMNKSDAESNVVSVRLDQAAGSKFSVSPGSRVTDVQPLRVNQTRTPPATTGFYGVPGRQRFMGASYAGNLVYDQISILDPNDILFEQRRKTRFFYGFCRFGIDPFTAELAVEIPMKRPRSLLGTFYVGFMKKSDMSPVARALDAIGAAKSLRDNIFVDTEIYRPVQLSDEMTLGSFNLGQTIKVK